MKKTLSIVTIAIAAIPLVVLAGDDDEERVSSEVQQGEDAIKQGGTAGAADAAEHWGKAVDIVTETPSHDSSDESSNK